MVRLFNQAGISHALARILLANPKDFPKKLAALRRTIRGLAHPDVVGVLEGIDAGSIFAAFDQLAELDQDQLRKVAIKLDHPERDDGLTGQLLELQHQLATVETVRQAERDGLSSQLAQSLASNGLVAAEIARQSSLAVLEMVWAGRLAVHTPLLVYEHRLTWSKATQVPKSRLLRLAATIRVLGSDGLTLTHQLQLETASPGVDKEGRSSYFLGDRIPSYIDNVTAEGRALAESLRNGQGLGGAREIVLGFAPDDFSTKRVIGRYLGRREREAKDDSPQSIGSATMEEIRARTRPMSKALTMVRELCDYHQPEFSSYWLALWQHGTNRGTLTFERYDPPAHIRATL